VSTDLWDWSKNNLGDLEKRIKRARRDLEACRKGMLNGQNVSREAILRYKLERLEDQKELYWRQRAHVHWLREGDRNTKFFHQYASDRKRINKINKLVKDDGGVVEDTSGLKLLITDFYKSLFESHAGARFEELLNQVHQKVTTDMNNYLMGEYRDEEIKQALDSMGDLKAPGVDGMCRRKLVGSLPWGISTVVVYR